MRRIARPRIVFVALIASATVGGTALAGAPALVQKAVAHDIFDRGAQELQFSAGAFLSFGNYSELRPQLADLDASVRLGWMFGPPDGSGIWRGNFEFLAELSGAGVVKGPGTVLTGLSLLVRYNFIAPESRVVPYFQIGVGGLYNDVFEERTQSLLGSAFEFNLQGAFGVRYLCGERCAIFLEANYRHISNANLADRNAGMNSAGSLLGVSWFF